MQIIEWNSIQHVARIFFSDWLVHSGNNFLTMIDKVTHIFSSRLLCWNKQSNPFFIKYYLWVILFHAAQSFIRYLNYRAGRNKNLRNWYQRKTNHPSNREKMIATFFQLSAINHVSPQYQYCHIFWLLDRPLIWSDSSHITKIVSQAISLACRESDQIAKSGYSVFFYSALFTIQFRWHHIFHSALTTRLL